jgi:hypothetical protein
MMMWKGFGRKRLWYNPGTITAFSWWDRRKTRKSPVRIVGVLAEIRTENLSNTNAALALRQPAL